MGNGRIKRRVKRTLISLGLGLLSATIIGGGWALNRFVIDHVEITDVRAYEAAASAAATTSPTEASPTAATTSDGEPTTAPTATSSSQPPTATAAPTKPVSTTTSTPKATPTKTGARTPTATPSATPSASATATATPSPSASKPVITANSYTASGVRITIAKVVKGSGNEQVTYYVADIEVKDATKVRSAFAHNEFGQNIIDYPSAIAKDNNAIFAVNGDYYGFRDSGIEIRNGVVYRDRGARMGLAMYRDGTVKVYDETKTNGQALVDAGVWNTMSFGPALLINGEVPSGIETFQVDTNIGARTIQGLQPRTAFGFISDNHYVFVAVDGRAPGYSRGVTMTQMAQIMQGLDCTVAYNLDGGGSTTMYFNGSVVNRPSGQAERGTSDIFYVGK